MKILHVDDDPIDLLLVGDVIKELNAGSKLAQRTSPELALSIAPLWLSKGGIVLCDYGMPGMDGLEFVKKIRSSCEGDVRCILHTNVDPKTLGNPEGVDAIWEKGMNYDDFRQRIAGLIAE